MTRFAYVLLAVLTNLTSACKSTSSRTLASSSSVPEHVYRVVDIHNLRYVLPIAQPKYPIAKNLAGIQYCRGACYDGKMGLNNGIIGMTVANGAEDAKTLSFHTSINQNYALKSAGRADKSPAPTPATAYRINFKDDAHATLQVGRLENGKFSGGAPSDVMRMTLIEPGHWLRETTGADTYHLYTIIDKDGNETEHYPLFVDDIKTSHYSDIVVSVPADTPLGRGEEVLVDGLMGPFRDADRAAWKAKVDGAAPLAARAEEGVNSNSRDDGDSTVREELAPHADGFHPLDAPTKAQGK